jgi:transcriptional regulator with XRE-family HTH domain
MVNVYESRLDFGRRLREMRSKAQWSLRDLAIRSTISFNVISGMELGEKPTSGESAVKLADAFQLAGEERDAFLLAAAGTKRRDKLIASARLLPPEILNFVVQALQRAGVDLGAIESCNLNTGEPGGGEGLMVNFQGGKAVQCNLSLNLNPVGA